MIRLSIARWPKSMTEDTFSGFSDPGEQVEGTSLGQYYQEVRGKEIERLEGKGERARRTKTSHP